MDNQLIGTKICVTIKEDGTSKSSQIRNSTGTNVPMSESYTYDPLQRLTNATDSYAGKSTSMWYEYDSLGNRVAQSLSNTFTQYSYNPANNELLNSTSAGTTTRYGYDKRRPTVKGCRFLAVDLQVERPGSTVEREQQ